MARTLTVEMDELIIGDRFLLTPIAVVGRRIKFLVEIRDHKLRETEEPWFDRSPGVAAVLLTSRGKHA